MPWAVNLGFEVEPYFGLTRFADASL